MRDFSVSLILCLASLPAFGGVSVYECPTFISMKPTVSPELCMVELKNIDDLIELIDPVSDFTVSALVNPTKLDKIRAASCVDPSRTMPLEYLAHHDRGIYFDFAWDENSPWSNCYTTGYDEALARVRNHDHKGFGGVVVSNIASNGEQIGFNVTKDGVVKNAVISSCFFDNLDVFRTRKCEVTVVEGHPFKDVGNLRKYIAYDRELRAKLGEKASIIDCRKKVIKRVSNTWEQKFSLHDIKIARELVGEGLPMTPITSVFGEVVLGGSSKQEVRWSANLEFPFLSTYSGREGCNSSIIDLSLEGGVETVINEKAGQWCSKGLQISYLNCERGLPIEDYSVEMEISFSEAPRELVEYCRGL